MEMIRHSKGINKKKEDGTRVSYFLFPEYEIHYNELPPNTTQQWHYHEKVEEVIFAIASKASSIEEATNISKGSSPLGYLLS